MSSEIHSSFNWHLTAIEIVVKFDKKSFYLFESNKNWSLFKKIVTRKVRARSWCLGRKIEMSNVLLLQDTNGIFFLFERRSYPFHARSDTKKLPFLAPLCAWHNVAKNFIKMYLHFKHLIYKVRTAFYNIEKLSRLG